MHRITPLNPCGEVRRLTRRRGIDLVIENTGAATWSDSQNILRKAAKLVALLLMVVQPVMRI
jgi:NADPH:quinone reductase-like Zn-dependent oxidoreductase